MSEFDKNHRRTPESAALAVAELVSEHVNLELRYDQFAAGRVFRVADLGAGGGALSKAILRDRRIHVYAVDRKQYPGDEWPDVPGLTVCDADILAMHASYQANFAEKCMGVRYVHGVVMNPPFNQMAEFLKVAATILHDPTEGSLPRGSLGIFALLPLRWMASEGRLRQLQALHLTLEGISIFERRPSFLAFEDGAWVEGKSGAAEDFGVFHFLPSSERLATTGPAERGQIRIL